MIKVSDGRLGRGIFVTAITLLLLVGILGSTVYLSVSTESSSKSNAAEVKHSFNNDKSQISKLDLDEQHILTIGERQIDARIRRNEQDAAVELDGDNRPIDFDFPQVVAQIHHRTSGNLKIASIEFVDTPNLRIENQVIIGGNISLTNCPNSIVRNNTIKDVVQPASGITRGFGIRLDNCSNSLVTNNTLSNISSAETSEVNNWAYGIWIADSNDTTISGNILANISGNRYSRGIYWSSEKNIKNLTIIDNVFTNITVSASTTFTPAAYGIELALSQNFNDTRIANNSFTGLSAKGVHANTYGLAVPGGNLDGMIVTNNSFTNSSSTATGAIGRAESYELYFEVGTIANLTITSNTITATSANGTEGASGEVFSAGINLQTGPADNLHIRQNSFINGSFISNARIDVYGMFLEINDESNNLTIAENTFTNSSGTSISGQAQTYGLNLYQGASNNTLITANSFTDSSASANAVAYSYAISIEIASTNANNLTITDNTFGDTSAISSNDWAYTYGVYLYIAENLTNCRIASNTFTNGSATASGSAYSYNIDLFTNADAINLTIMDNTFGDTSATSGSDYAWAYGVFLDIAADLNNCRIASNAFTDSSATSGYGARTRGVELAAGNNINNFTISDNTFGDTSATSGSGGSILYGFNLSPTGTATNITINGNSFMDNSASSSSGAATSYGIFMEGFENATLRANTFANVSVFSSGTIQAYGLFADGCNGTQIVQNIITSTTPSAFHAIYLRDSYGANVTLYETSLYNVTWADPSLATNAFTVYRNGSTIDSGTLTATNNITLDTTGLIPRVYNFTIFISSLSVTDTLFITVLDAIPPTVSTPNDLTIEDDSTGNTLSWAIADANGINAGFNAFFYVNGSLDASQTGLANTTSSVGYSLDNLAVGVYNITVVVYDSSGNYAANTVIVTVQDTIAPVIVSSSGDLTYEDDLLGNAILWNATDANPWTYRILQNGTQVANSSWASAVNISYSIDEVAPGVYNFTIFVADAFGNQIADTVIITVQDTIAPSVVSSSGNVLIEDDSTGNNISWTATDANAGTYRIVKNGTQVANGTWTSGTAIPYNIDAYGVGDYNFTMVATDAFGNWIAETVNVTVQDTTPPVIVSLSANATIEEGIQVLTIAWNATDANPGTYRILQNGTQIADGSWTSGTAILYSAEGLAAGGYNFTLIVTDAFGNSVAETALVTVTEPVSSTTTSGDEDDGLNPFVIIGVGVVAVAAISAGAGAAIIYIRRIRGP